jgi:hypothetical protein
MTLTRRENHVLQHVMAGVDILILSLYLQARGLIKREISRHLGEPADREELRKNRDVDLKLIQTWVSQTLGIKDGRELGSRNKPKPFEAQEGATRTHELEMLKAMCEILKASSDEDKLTKTAVIKQMRRSRSTVYQWFREGLGFVRMKNIALIMYNDHPAFTKWKRTGGGFERMLSSATRVYENNFH